MDIITPPATIAAADKTTTGARPVPWQEYQASRLEWFRSGESFRWFQMQNRAELTQAGALAVIAGRVFVVPDAFDAAVLTIGQRLAAARAA